MGRAARDAGAAPSTSTRCEQVEVDVPHGKLIERIPVPRPLLEADVVDRLPQAQDPLPGPDDRGDQALGGRRPPGHDAPPAPRPRAGDRRRPADRHPARPGGHGRHHRRRRGTGRWPSEGGSSAVSWPQTTRWRSTSSRATWPVSTARRCASPAPPRNGASASPIAAGSTCSACRWPRGCVRLDPGQTGHGWERRYPVRVLVGEGVTMAGDARALQGLRRPLAGAPRLGRRGRAQGQAHLHDRPRRGPGLRGAPRRVATSCSTTSRWTPTSATRA